MHVDALLLQAQAFSDPFDYVAYKERRNQEKQAAERAGRITVSFIMSGIDFLQVYTCLISFSMHGTSIKWKTFSCPLFQFSIWPLGILLSIDFSVITIDYNGCIRTMLFVPAIQHKKLNFMCVPTCVYIGGLATLHL